MIPDSTGTQQPTGGPQERISSLRAAILRISGSLGLDTALREIAGSIRCSSAPASSILDTTVGSARYSAPIIRRTRPNRDDARPGSGPSLSDPSALVPLVELPQHDHPRERCPASLH